MSKKKNERETFVENFVIGALSDGKFRDYFRLFEFQKIAQEDVICDDIEVKPSLNLQQIFLLN